MNEFQKKLRNKYPDIYGKVGLSVKEGWFNLLDDLGSEIIEKIKKTKEFKVLQIKEKFGTLRFYVKIEAETDLKKEIMNSIHNAEKRSSIICEICGDENAKQYVNQNLHQYTACDKHIEDNSYTPVEYQQLIELRYNISIEKNKIENLLKESYPNISIEIENKYDKLRNNLKLFNKFKEKGITPKKNEYKIYVSFENSDNKDVFDYIINDNDINLTNLFEKIQKMI